MWSKNEALQALSGLKERILSLAGKGNEALKGALSRLPDSRVKRFALFGGGVAVLLVLIALLVALQRPGDVSEGEDSDFREDEASLTARVVPWRLYGFDGTRARYLPSSYVRPPFKVRWSFRAHSLLEFSPVIADGVVYGFSNDGESFALRRDTGKAIWRRQVSSLNASSPVYSNGVLYGVSLEPGTAFALSAATGRLLWKRDLPGRSESSPLIADGKMIFGCETGQLFALEVQTGKTVWKTEVGGAIKAAPALESGTLYVAAYGGILKAVDLTDGSEIWSAGSQSGGLLGSGNFYATPAVAFDRIYVGNTDGRMYSFERRSGELAWSRSTGAYVYAAAVAADTPLTKPSVYFGSYDGEFYSLDARTGEVNWQKPVGGAVSGAASLIGGTLFVSNLRKTTTLGLNARTGKRNFGFPDGAYNPAVSDGRWLILTGKRRIYGLEPMDRDKAKAKKAAGGG
jgi:outer membrane protein assembly factor BamB